MDDEDAGGQTSGLLSPRRIEAIHIAFTKVFDTACKQGFIRDPSTYKSFDHVFNKAMKRQRGQDVDSESDHSRPVEPLGGDVEGEAMDIVEETTTTTTTAAVVVEKNVGSGGQSVQVVVNKKEEVVRDDEIYISDDEDESKRLLQHVKRKRRKPDYSMDRIDGSPQNTCRPDFADFEDDIGFKKPKRMRHSEPPIINRSRSATAHPRL